MRHPNPKSIRDGPSNESEMTDKNKGTIAVRNVRFFMASTRRATAQRGDRAVAMRDSDRQRAARGHLSRSRPESFSVNFLKASRYSGGGWEGPIWVAPVLGFTLGSTMVGPTPGRVLLP